MCKHIYIFFSLVTLTLSGRHEYRGLLTPGCIQSYYRLFVTRTVESRDYYYFHETLNAQNIPSTTDYNENSTNIDIMWRIVGGQIISITQAPYQVLYGSYCGGTLIAPQWVLTAAHCKENDELVYAGSTQRSLATQYRICAHFTHPMWNKAKAHSHDYDYQLILLESPIPISNNARPIAIGPDEDLKNGAMVAVSGWGHLKYKKSWMQDLLRRVYVPVISNDVCKDLGDGFYKNITNNMFCAGYREGNKDSCQGDSGGPAVYNGKLVGIVSFGVGCAMANKPGVYSKVPVARNWIQEITGLPL